MDKIYKVLVADDEYWIREQMRVLLNWEEYEIDFLEPAVDGEDLEEKIASEKPDIIITDINMPIINGVEVLKHVQKKYPEIVSIIISGYSDFDYVKEGLLAGAIDYMLKPVTKIDLVNTLTRALEIINERRLLEEKQKYERNELLRATSALTDRELSTLICKERGIGRDISRESMLPMNQMPDEGYNIVLVKIYGINSVADVFNHDMNLLSYSVKQQLREALGEKVLFLFNNIFRSSEFVLALNVSTDMVMELAYSMLFTMNNFTGKQIAVGISGRHYAESDFRKGYEEARHALMDRTFSNKNKVVTYQKQKNAVAPELKLTQKQEGQLILLLKESPAGVKKYVFSTVGIERCQEEEWPVRVIKDTLIKIFSLVEAFGKKQEISIEEQEGLKEAVLHEAEDNNFIGLMELLEEYFDMVLCNEEEDKNYNSGKETIKAIVEYVEKHYFEEISLTLLADSFHIESSYLSKLFKKETGQNLMSYIATARMEKAKLMIHNEKLSLTEIAFAVGYDDYNYFNKVFRKVVGESPREYKSKITSKNL